MLSTANTKQKIFFGILGTSILLLSMVVLCGIAKANGHKVELPLVFLSEEQTVLVDNQSIYLTTQQEGQQQLQVINRKTLQLDTHPRIARSISLYPGGAVGLSQDGLHLLRLSGGKITSLLGFERPVTKVENYFLDEKTNLFLVTTDEPVYQKVCDVMYAVRNHQTLWTHNMCNTINENVQGLIIHGGQIYVKHHESYFSAELLDAETGKRLDSDNNLDTYNSTDFDNFPLPQTRADFVTRFEAKEYSSPVPEVQASDCQTQEVDGQNPAGSATLETPLGLQISSQLYQLIQCPEMQVVVVAQALQDVSGFAQADSIHYTQFFLIGEQQ